jgi:hypothetical protein
MSAFNIHEFRQRKKRERLALEASYNKGKKAALRQFKLSETMGADYGVAPRGPTQSHGTTTVPYPNNGSHETADLDMSQRLWDLFGKGKEAPGGAGGQYGTETIG